MKRIPPRLVYNFRNRGRKRMKRILFILLLLQFSSFLFSITIAKDILWFQGSLVVDKEGNLFVGYDESTILKYSPLGKELLKIGQKGTGPSDLRRIGSFSISPTDNRLYVTEYYEGNRWVSMFNVTTGKFIGTWNFAMDWKKYDVVIAIDFDSQGSVFVLLGKHTFRRNKDFEISNQKKDLLRFSAAGKLIGKIYEFSADSSGFAQGNFTATIPFKNFLNYTIYQDKIIVKEGCGEFISVFAANGRLEKRIPFPVKREKVTAADIDAWEKELSSERSIIELAAIGRGDVKFWKKRLPFPEYKPNSGSCLLCDAKGNIYINEYTQFQERDPLWFKINLQTGKTDHFKLKHGQFLNLINNNDFYFSKTDEEEGTETITKVTETELDQMMEH
jgi:hypothetical protein